MPEIVFWIAGGAVALFVLDRLFLWMEARGWIYWRRIKRKGSGGGYLLGPDVFDPGKRHLEDAREERAVEEQEDGDDDGRRKKSDRVT